MSVELDRRIAVEVMGEPEPSAPRMEAGPWGDVVVDEKGAAVATPSPGGNWRVTSRYETGDVPEWVPLPFSTDFDTAMRAVDEVQKRDDRFLVEMVYRLHVWGVAGGVFRGEGQWFGEVDDVTHERLPAEIRKLVLASLEKGEHT